MRAAFKIKCSDEKDDFFLIGLMFFLFFFLMILVFIYFQFKRKEGLCLWPILLTVTVFSYIDKIITPYDNC